MLRATQCSVLIFLLVSATMGEDGGQDVLFEEWLYQNRDFMEISILSRPGSGPGSDPKLDSCGNLYKNTSSNSKLNLLPLYNSMSSYKGDMVLPKLTVGWETCTTEHFDIWEYFVRFMIDPDYNGNIPPDSKPNIESLTNDFRFVICNQLSTFAQNSGDCPGVSKLATPESKNQATLRSDTCTAFSDSKGQLDNIPFKDAQTYITKILLDPILQCGGSYCSFLDKLTKEIDTDNFIQIDTQNKLDDSFSDAACYDVGLGDLREGVGVRLFSLGIDNKKFNNGNGTFPIIPCKTSADCDYSTLTPRVCVGKDESERQCIPCPFVNVTNKDSYQAGAFCQAGNLQYCVEGYHCKEGFFCAEASQGRLGGYTYPSIPDGVCTTDGFCEELGGDHTSTCAAESQLAVVYFYTTNGEIRETPCLGDGVKGRGFTDDSSSFRLNTPFAKLVLPYDCGNGTNMKRVFNLVNSKYTEAFFTNYNDGYTPVYENIGYADFYQNFCVDLPKKSIGQDSLLNKIESLVKNVFQMESRTINITDRHIIEAENCGPNHDTAWCVTMDTCLEGTQCSLVDSSKVVLGGIQVVPGNSLRLSFYPGGQNIANDELYQNKSYFGKLYDNNVKSVSQKGGLWESNFNKYLQKYQLDLPRSGIVDSYRCPATHPYPYMGYSYKYHPWDMYDKSNFNWKPKCCDKKLTFQTCQESCGEYDGFNIQCCGEGTGWLKLFPGQSLLHTQGNQCGEYQGVESYGVNYLSEINYDSSAWSNVDCPNATKTVAEGAPPCQAYDIIPALCPETHPYPYDANGVIGSFCCFTRPESSGKYGPNFFDVCDHTNPVECTRDSTLPCRSNVLLNGKRNLLFDANRSHWCPFEAPYPYLSSKAMENVISLTKDTQNSTGSTGYNYYPVEVELDPTRAADSCCSKRPTPDLNGKAPGVMKCDDEKPYPACNQVPCMDPNLFVISGGQCPKEVPYVFKYGTSNPDSSDTILKYGCCQLPDTSPITNLHCSERNGGVNITDGFLCADFNCKNYSEPDVYQTNSVKGDPTNIEKVFNASTKEENNINEYASCPKAFPYAFAFTPPGKTCKLYCGRDPELLQYQCGKCCSTTKNANSCDESDQSCKTNCAKCSTMVHSIFYREAHAPQLFLDYVNISGWTSTVKLYNYNEPKPANTKSKSWRTAGQLPMSYMGAFREFTFSDTENNIKKVLGGEFFLPDGVDGINVGGESMATQTMGCSYMRPVMSEFKGDPVESNDPGEYNKTCPFSHPFPDPSSEYKKCCKFNCFRNGDGCGGHTDCPTEALVACDETDPNLKCTYYEAFRGQCSSRVNVKHSGFDEPLKSMYGEMNYYTDSGTNIYYYHGTKGGPQTLNPYVLNSIDYEMKEQNPCMYGDESDGFAGIRNHFAPPPLTIMFPEFCYAISKEDFESKNYFTEKRWIFSNMQTDFLNKITNLQGFETLKEVTNNFFLSIQSICEPMWNNDLKNDLMWKASVSFSPGANENLNPDFVQLSDPPTFENDQDMDGSFFSSNYIPFGANAAKYAVNEAEMLTCLNTESQSSDPMCAYFRGMMRTNDPSDDQSVGCGSRTRLTVFSKKIIEVLTASLRTRPDDSTPPDDSDSELRFGLNNLSFYGLTEHSLDNLKSKSSTDLENLKPFDLLSVGGQYWNFFPQYPQGTSSKNGVCFNYGISTNKAVSSGLVSLYQAYVVKYNEPESTDELAYSYNFQENQYDGGFECLQSSEVSATHDYPIKGEPSPIRNLIRVNSNDSKSQCFCQDGSSDVLLSQCDFTKTINGDNEAPPPSPLPPTMPPTSAPTSPPPTPKPTSLGDIIKSENDDTTREIGLLAAIFFGLVFVLMLLVSLLAFFVQSSKNKTEIQLDSRYCEKFYEKKATRRRNQDNFKRKFRFNV